MKKIVFIFFALLFFYEANAQNQIYGVVIDNRNQPLVGASVFVPELNKGTVTNIDGEYSLSNLPTGNLEIQFSFIGYKVELRTVKMEEGDNHLDVQLDIAIIQSQEVVVSGSHTTSQHENAVKIDLLNSQDVLLSGSSSIMETLTSVPGVDMIAKGPGVTKPVIRGLSMNDILVLNNGVRIENYQFSENHPLGIDDSNIDRVEIIKGSASLLYGSDAIGGVLNFIKEHPAPTSKVQGAYKAQLYSNTKGVNQYFNVKGSSKSFFAGLSIAQKSHADYLQGNNEFVPNSRFNELTFNANAGYTGKIGVFKLFYDYFSQDLGMSVPAVNSLILERARKNEIWYQDLKHHMLSSQNRFYFGGFKVLVNIAYQDALRKLQTTFEEPFVEMDLRTLTYDTKLHFPSGEKTKFIVGVQGMFQQNQNLNDRLSQFLPDADIYNTGFLGLGQYQINNKLRFQGGLRYDFYNTETYALGTEGAATYHAPVQKDYSSFSGSLGLTFNPVEKINLRINLAKAFRVPNLSELTSNGLHGNRYEIGNADLTPQDAYEADISMHYHGEYLSFDLAGYYNIIQNYIYISPTNDTTANGILLYQFSQTDAMLVGGEAGLHFHPRKAPWLHLKSTYTSVVGKEVDGNFLPFIPANKWRQEIRLERKSQGIISRSGITFKVQTAFMQSRPSPYEGITDGYTLFDLGLFSELSVANQTVNLALTINNLFNTSYYDHLSTLKMIGYFNQGRNISFTLKIPFGI